MIDIPSVSEHSVVEGRVRDFAVFQRWEDEANRSGGVDQGRAKGMPELTHTLPTTSHVLDQALIPGSGGHFKDPHPHGGVELVLHDGGYDCDWLVVPAF